MKKKKFEECLQTIENCLALKNVADSVKIKVLIRKVECQKNLFDPDAGRTYEEALLFIRQKIPAADQEKMKLKLEDALDADMELRSNKNLFEPYRKRRNAERSSNVPQTIPYHFRRLNQRKTIGRDYSDHKKL